MADESKNVEIPEQKQKNDYEIFWDRIKEEDKVLVKAPIATQPSKTCYFLGTVKATSIHKEDENHVVVIQLEGETESRAIKLENIGSIEDVKKTIIPMDFIFKDENIKAGKLENAEFTCEEDDDNCDGEINGPGDAIEIVDKAEDGDPYDSDDSDDFKDVEKEEHGWINQHTGSSQNPWHGGKKKKKKNRSRSKKNKKKRKRKNSTKKKN